MDLPERQVLTFLPTSKGMLLGAGDAAAVYRAAPAGADAAYLSEVLDAGAAATWGRLTHFATGGVVWAARVGNTAKPDDHWTPWTRLADKSKKTEAKKTKAKAVKGLGAGASVSLKGMPTARYFQYRAQLPKAGARLSGVRVSSSRKTWRRMW